MTGVQVGMDLLKKTFFLSLMLMTSVMAQPVRPNLKEVSSEVNKSLPEIYDPVTKLISTTVENKNFKYHFIVDATDKEFKWALPKVKAQILKTICSKSTERSVLKVHKANIVYSYENVKGQSLGEFMVRPEHCRRK